MAMRGIWMIAGLLGLALARPALAQVPEPLPPEAVEASPVATAPAQVPPAEIDGVPALTRADAEAWLDGFMPYALAAGDIAGAVVVVVKDGQVLLQKGYGYADLEKHTPVDPADTLFRPGSISKLFTWTAVMQLVEQGQLDLDADVNQYLEFEIPAYEGKPAKLRQNTGKASGRERGGPEG